MAHFVTKPVNFIKSNEFGTRLRLAGTHHRHTIVVPASKQAERNGLKEKKCHGSATSIDFTFY